MRLEQWGKECSSFFSLRMDLDARVFVLIRVLAMGSSTNGLRELDFLG